MPVPPSSAGPADSGAGSGGSAAPPADRPAPSTPGAPPRPVTDVPAGLLSLFGATIFLAAALLFLVQPMVGKMVLPRLGGSPEVWNTSMVFFQLALLAGYLYAHWSVRLLGPRRQAAAHFAVLLLPLAVLPLALPAWAPPRGGWQSPWLMGVLAAGVGAPFFVLAAASPLLQRWLAATRHEAARDPYFLYAASNAGSLLGLLAYPLLLEPLLPLGAQSRVWSLGYAGFVVLAGLCAFRVLGGGGAPADRSAGGEVARSAGAVEVGPEPSAGDRLFWTLCAFVPACLLLAVTHYLTLDVAPVPLLWVLPLAVYLVTYVVAFLPRPPVSTATLSRWMAIVAVVLALVLLARLRDPVWLLVVLHLGVLAVTGLLCHSRLAASRPSASHLTGFYVFVAVGGVLGGAFAALLGPWLFSDLLEYPIALVLASALRVRALPGEGGWSRKRVLDVALPVGLGAFVIGVDLAAAALPEMPDGLVVALGAGLPALACFLFSPRRLRFSLALAVLLALAYSDRLERGRVLHAERTFFGIHRVVHDPAGNLAVLMHGTTVHGVQSTDPARAREPLGYYHPTGPGGAVVRRLAERPEPTRVALVGLGTGALAVLAAPHQHLVLYEIDEAVLRIAEDPRFFTYLTYTAAPYQAVVGDGRVALAETEEPFDLVVLDAFSSSSIPVHLLTLEAVELYVSRLAPGGALLFHLSNQHLTLGPVLGSVAAAVGLAAFERFDVREETEQGIFSSHWAVLARQEADVVALLEGGWRPLLPGSGRVWTDDFSNVLSVYRWN